MLIDLVAYNLTAAFDIGSFELNNETHISKQLVNFI